MIDYSFRFLSSHEIKWGMIESCSDSTCYHTQSWVSFQRECGNRPFAIAIEDIEKNTDIGFIIGTQRSLLQNNLFLSPNYNDGTYVGGGVFTNPISKEERCNVYLQLFEWLKTKKRKIYLSIIDWSLREHEDIYIPENEYHFPVLDKLRIHYKSRTTYWVDLQRTEQEIWNSLSYKSCKYCINKAVRNGLKIQLITNIEDIQSFVNLHFAQIKDVAKRHHTCIRPYQKKTHLLRICNSLFPNKILLLQAKDANNNIMATGIFIYNNSSASFFTEASYSRYHKYSPNEFLVWEGIKILKLRGVKELLLCGFAPYKRKYGSSIAYLPIISFSNLKYIEKIKRVIKKALKILHLR